MISIKACPEQGIETGNCFLQVLQLSIAGRTLGEFLPLIQTDTVIGFEPTCVWNGTKHRAAAMAGIFGA